MSVADRLFREFKVSAAYSSDLKRAFETAEKIAATCGIVEGGGESLDKLYERCTSSLERIAAKHTGERVVVVTHGGCHQRTVPTSLPKWKVWRKDIEHVCQHLPHIIRTWGDVSHLNETGYLKSGFGGEKTSG